MKLRNSRHLSRDFLDPLIREGDCVVDATAGNGHDALYLARKVGKSGHVYAFDIQQSALDATKKRLEEADALDQATLVCASHAEMALYVQQPVRAVLFNLGWLPGADHELTTRVSSTIPAVQAAMRLLAPGGVVSVCIYPGHQEGKNERQALLDLLGGTSLQDYNILHCAFVNQKNDPPELILIQREGLDALC